MKSGARGAQRAYSENKLDRRCGWVKEYEKAKRELFAARGLTETTADAERRTLINRIAFKQINLKMRENAALNAMRKAPQAPPPDLGKDFFTCGESLRRDLMALQTLDDRHARRKRERAGDWTTEEPPPEAESDHEQQATH